LAALLAVFAGVGLWGLWWRAGFPAGAFTPGLEGHGPDPFAWPRLLALWVPAGQLLFLAAYAWLDGTDRGGVLRRCFVVDQAASLVLMAGLAAMLLALQGQGAWRTMIGAWYVLFVGAKTAVFLRGLWSWLAGESPGSWRASGAVFLGAFAPYLLLGAH